MNQESRSAGSRPRVAGFLLLAMVVFFTVFFDLPRVIDDPFRMGAVFVLLFFVGPLLVAGLALLRHKEDQS